MSSQVQLISRSKVQASWMVSPGKDILVWVTGTEAPNTGPVVNATAYVYTTNGVSCAHTHTHTHTHHTHAVYTRLVLEVSVFAHV